MLHLTEKSFEAEAMGSALPVIVMFYASWCGKCAMMKPVIEEIEEKYLGRIRFCEAETSECPGLAAKYQTDIVPSFVFFKDGRIQGQLEGLIDGSVFEQRINKIFRNC